MLLSREKRNTVWPATRCSDVKWSRRLSNKTYALVHHFSDFPEPQSHCRSHFHLEAISHRHDDCCKSSVHTSALLWPQTLWSATGAVIGGFGVRGQSRPFGGVFCGQRGGETEVHRCTGCSWHCGCGHPLRDDMWVHLTVRAIESRQRSL